MRKMKKILVAVVVIIAAIIIVITNMKPHEVDRDLLQENLQQINNTGNGVFNDIPGSEKKYLELLETETDPFNRGMYCSALVQIYTAKSEYDKVVAYGQQAVENYELVENGAFYAIKEREYLSWSMLNMHRYSDSFLIAEELLEAIHGEGKMLLTQEEKVYMEDLIYAIFTSIYAEFDILDQAEIYYNRLVERGTSKDFKVEYAKYKYANKIEEPYLAEQYANEHYKIIQELDKRAGTSASDTGLLYLGTANRKQGNYELALEQLTKAEACFSILKDQSGLTSTYVEFAECYKTLEEQELMIDYYKKAMEIAYKQENYADLKPIVEDVVDYFEEYNMQEELAGIYPFYYKVATKAAKDQSLNKLISQIVEINNELMESEHEFLQNQIKRNRSLVGIGAGVILLLTLMLFKGYLLVKKKNETEKKLEALAHIDYLTGISTRAYGERLILEKLEKGGKCAIAMIDIDDFKRINDSYGHTYGDYILKSVAMLLEKAINSDDSVYRFGGEEFVIAFMDQDKMQAKERLDKIREQVNQIIFENDVRVSFSAGITEWTQPPMEFAIKEADKLLYKAKNEGKNQVCITTNE